MYVAQAKTGSQRKHGSPVAAPTLPPPNHLNDHPPLLTLHDAANHADAALAFAESWMRAHADAADARDVLAACGTARRRLAQVQLGGDDPAVAAAAVAALEHELLAVEALLAHERAHAAANAAQEALQHRLELHDLHENASKENAMLQVRNELLLRQLDEAQRERERLEADCAAQRGLALQEEGARFRRLSQRGSRAARRCERMELQVRIGARALAVASQPALGQCG